ncbi:hypothetical protein GGS23DRAFT_295426 [Durotheca rogersii]|uniref:uncharacterized protein n=1 Tax=Durotheca rogersii TaxID=419775 RepID=UPI002220BCBA|nr:uncharacterized protein GGS23DRAFT_295426 [Durotheca rogersii]KAI5866914.1 hypothetical protein GGS23DRAFT_295426 [Durotheca rogersii]
MCAMTVTLSCLALSQARLAHPFSESSWWPQPPDLLLARCHPPPPFQLPNNRILSYDRLDLLLVHLELAGRDASLPGPLPRSLPRLGLGFLGHSRFVPCNCPPVWSIYIIFS